MGAGALVFAVEGTPTPVILRRRESPALATTKLFQSDHGELLTASRVLSHRSDQPTAGDADRDPEGPPP